MPAASAYGARRPRRRAARRAIARMAALAALLVATSLVLAVLREAREPSRTVPPPGIQPLPRQLLSP
jgi:hypothetical protein